MSAKGDAFGFCATREKSFLWFLEKKKWKGGMGGLNNKTKMKVQHNGRRSTLVELKKQTNRENKKSNKIENEAEMKNKIIFTQLAASSLESRSPSRVHAERKNKTRVVNFEIKIIYRLTMSTFFF